MALLQDLNIDDNAVFVLCGDNGGGVRAHTMSSANVFELALNGKLVCEAELSAFLAGHFEPSTRRSGNWNSSLRLSAVSIAKSEYLR